LLEEEGLPIDVVSDELAPKLPPLLADAELDEEELDDAPLLGFGATRLSNLKTID
jgi:hypothetical protein